MPRTPSGGIFYYAVFVANGIEAGFDINWSGYMETTTINQTVRTLPWNPSNGGDGVVAPYSLMVQNGSYNPIMYEYNVTVYSEQHYGALRALVGHTGVLQTPRESFPNNSLQPAMLISCKRGNFQYPAWPNNVETSTGSNMDMQTVIIDFIKLAF